MDKKINTKQEVKDNPKVPISLRVPFALKEELKEKAALQNKKLSEYLSDIFKKEYSRETNNITTEKETHLLLEDLNTVEKENESFWHNQKQGKPLTEPTIPKTDSKLKYDEELILLIEPHVQETFQRHINHLRKKGGTVSDVIVASLIAITDNKYRLFPKSFNYHLTGVLLNTYADNQPYTPPIKKINYREIAKCIFWVFLFLLFIRKMRSQKFK